MKGQINAAANFQVEDFEFENATEIGNFNSLAKDNNYSTPLGIANSLNTKLENSAQAKDQKNEMPFSSRRSSSHTLKLSPSENAKVNVQDKTPSAARGKPGIARLFKGRNSVNITPSAKIPYKVQRSSAIDYSAAESIGSRLLNICKGEEEGIYFDQEINFLHTNACLYDVLLLQDEKNQDTPLHVAVKKNRISFVEKLLCLLKEPYLSNTFYKCKYFERNQENEKPLSKIINAKNKDGKDVITLAIEGNNSECLSALFKYLTYESINREKDVESSYTPLHEAVLLGKNEAIKELIKSRYVNTELIDRGSYKACNYANDKEAIELFIQYYSDKINNLRGRLADNNQKLLQIKCVLSKTKLTCVCLAAFGSCFGIYKNSHNTISEEVSKDMLHYSLELLFNTTGLILFFNYLIDTTLSKYEKENSSLNKEFTSYVKERNILENRLRYFQESTFCGTRATTQMSEIISVIPEAELSCSRL
ncbi:Ankyrin repeats (3 copies) [Wolbachia endosymbiont of Cylisticus convexus]|uniref:ankyrin repeat domain-containing protein n=1 Tax=Wolbachia endosymbiont of Cylisticus convexus TaxID=118728 RepID=UPI000DF67EE9|nr:ankyrin repeat domain-containing protein [Wolbachia endosymbiont of Cylisticus convexus]RDD35711.1 Ankyrin repeats (3 copies) [Wolbachia endosymbiont of Cylisticus convexus]